VRPDHRQLLGITCWPLAFLLFATIVSIFTEVGRTRQKLLSFPQISKAAERSLPLWIVVTFLLNPSIATTIFKTFLCDSIEFGVDASGAIETRRYLKASLALRCDSDEYWATRAIASAMIFVWPVGCPVLYAVLLWKSREAIRSGVPSRLSRATAMLSADYSPSAYWWEPLEMGRKLTLTGWVKHWETNAFRLDPRSAGWCARQVLLIGEESEQARVLVALLVSITFLALSLSMRPLKRCAIQNSPLRS
jgi:hypothetical protein